LSGSRTPEPSGRPPLKKARNAIRKSGGVNGFVLPNLSDASASPERAREDEASIIQASQEALLDAKRYRTADGRAISKRVLTSESKSPSPPRRGSTSMNGSSSASGFAPGLGKSIAVAMRVNPNMVDLTSPSPEPENAGSSRRNAGTSSSRTGRISDDSPEGGRHTSTRQSHSPSSTKRVPGSRMSTGGSGSQGASNGISSADLKGKSRAMASHSTSATAATEDESDGFEMLD